ncbi:ANTAR domain-containing protein, partial [Streptomyces flavofungini]|uniref:ANTAR domain-containing protein n=1 Tax=Streptomyces flavofungini TaxID=68200 RepID=UPI0034DF6558
PRWSPRAVGLGYRCVAALPLRGHSRTSGVLLLLTSDVAGLSEEAMTLGQSMADFTAVALEQACEAEEIRALAAQLETALTSRVVIEQATGVIAARKSLPMSDAFGLLRTYARSRRRILREVASEVVEGLDAPELMDPVS